MLFAPEDVPTAEREAQIARWKYLTEIALPARAREQNWPIRLDHCFKRICLDHAFQDVWYKHLARPAERHLEGEPLRRAVGCAEALLAGDRDLLGRYNLASLQYRGKLNRAGEDARSALLSSRSADIVIP